MKALGYVLAILGLVFLGSSMIIEVRSLIFKILEITPFAINDNLLMIIGLVLVAAGVFIINKYSRRRAKGMKAGEEVPIFKGNTVVGYRRH